MRRFTLAPAYLRKMDFKLPTLKGDGSEIGGLLENAYNEALHVMFNVNCIVKELSPNPVFVAGGEYSDVWTRDGSYNSYAAGSFLAPEITESTLRLLVAEGMVNGSIGGGAFDDLQFWDKVLWIIAARRHYALSHNAKFLELAVPVSRKTLEYQESHYYNAEFGLFRGPGFFLDSIGALPRPYAKIVEGKSCVAEYPEACQVMTLSVNALYVQAYRDAAALSTLAGEPPSFAEQCRRKADTLSSTIEKRFFSTGNGVPAYFIHGSGAGKGTAACYQEGAGIGFCLLFGIPSAKQAEKVFNKVHLEPRGIPVLWPNLGNDYLGSGKTGSTDSGYHTPQNITIWPQVNGLWILACAAYGKAEMLGNELENYARLIWENDGIFEIYHARTGKPKLWGHPAKKDQNWGAAAVLSSLHHGVFGMKILDDSLVFAPNIPTGWGQMTLSTIHYGSSTLEISISGNGSKIAEFKMDGQTQEPVVPWTLSGNHSIHIEMKGS